MVLFFKRNANVSAISWTLSDSTVLSYFACKLNTCVAHPGCITFVSYLDSGRTTFNTVYVYK